MIRVLLVDDEEPFLEVAKFFLDKEQNFRTETATSAEEALEKLGKGGYDAVVSDYAMPDMDGLELLKIMRAQGDETAFVLLTGKGREDVAIQALNYGADFYVQKGGDPKSQYAEIINAVKHSAQEKKALKDARDGARFITDVFLSIQDLIMVLDMDYTILRVNPAAERWYGGSAPLVGRKCYEAYHGRSEPCESCPSRRCLETGKMARELTSIRAPGQISLSWFDAYSFPMVNTRTGKMEGVIEYARNVTDWTRAEDALRLANERLSGILKASPVAIILLDPEGKVVVWNRGAERMLGYSEAEVLGKYLPGLPQDKVKDFVWFINALKEGQDFPALELKGIRKDGALRDLSVSAAPVKDSTGRITGLAGIVMDITDQKADKEAIVQAKKKLQILGRITRHDILNQITILMGWLDMANEIEKNEDVRNCLAKMDGALKAIRSLIQFTADYENMGVGSPQWLWIDRSFRESVEGLPMGDVKIAYELDGIEIYADPLLPRVFRNLTENSLRHGRKVSRIRIGSNESEQGLMVIFEDNGIGVPQENKERIFSEGFGDNTGYGLFMVREILGITGMTIEETGVPGDGARFEISVPKGQYRVNQV